VAIKASSVAEHSNVFTSLVSSVEPNEEVSSTDLYKKPICEEFLVNLRRCFACGF